MLHCYLSICWQFLNNLNDVNLPGQINVKKFYWIFCILSAFKYNRGLSIIILKIFVWSKVSLNRDIGKPNPFVSSFFFPQLISTILGIILVSHKPKQNWRACFSSNTSNHPPPTWKGKDSSLCQVLSQDLTILGLLIWKTT